MLKNFKTGLSRTALGTAVVFCVALGVPLVASAQDEGGGGTDSGGFFVEPALTYELGDTTINYPAAIGSSEGEYKGVGLGARLGFHANEAIFVGADARYSFADLDDEDSDYKADAKGYNWGPVVGLQMPQYGMRIWGTYILGGEADPDENNSLDIKFKDATGYRVGAGFHVKSFSVNLEYQALTYETTELEKVGPFSPGTNFSSVELDTESWIASVSFPLAL